MNENIKQMRERHEVEVSELRVGCHYHNKLSECMPFAWAPGHFSHCVIVCEFCGTEVKTTAITKFDKKFKPIKPDNWFKCPKRDDCWQFNQRQNFAQGTQAIKDAKAQSGDRRTVCPKPRPLDIAISDTVNELVLLACQECGVQGICKKDCEIVARGKQIVEIVEEDKRNTVCKPENERKQKVYNTAKR